MGLGITRSGYYYYFLFFLRIAANDFLRSTSRSFSQLTEVLSELPGEASLWKRAALRSPPPHPTNRISPTTTFNCFSLALALVATVAPHRARTVCLIVQRSMASHDSERHRDSTGCWLDWQSQLQNCHMIKISFHFYA